jgi:predicted CopG family antitoxin
MSNEKSTKSKTITLRNEIFDAVEEAAKRENRNFSNMIETFIIRADENLQRV